MVLGFDKRPRIYVQIASYRDPECQWTVRDLFLKARHPGRIFVGICWQFVAEEDAEFFRVVSRPRQVRVHKVHAPESLGLCWARTKTQALWQGEEYTLQIDSHMRFVEDWDERMIAMLERCPSDKAIVTTHPPSYTPPDYLGSPDLSRIHPHHFDDDGALMVMARWLDAKDVADGPAPAAICAGGFMFARAQLIPDVPYDPNIYFAGEEALFSVRAWTQGWDIYAPDEVVIYHFYGERDGVKRHWGDTDTWDAIRRRSIRRIRHVLGMDGECDPEDLVDIERYGLGTARTLKEYEAFSGVRFRERALLRIPLGHGVQLDDRQLQVSPDVAAFAVDDGLLLVSDRQQILFQLNLLAAQVWRGLEAGESTVELAQRLAQERGETPAQVENYVVNLIDQWSESGLLSDHEYRAATLPQPMWDDGWMGRMAPAIRTSANAEERHYELGGCAVTVRFGAGIDADAADPLLAHLRLETGEGESCRLDVVQGHDGLQVLVDRRLRSECSKAELPFELSEALQEVALRAASNCLGLRATVVGDAEGCVLVPVADPVQALRLADEALQLGLQVGSLATCLIDRESLAVRPFPAPVYLKDQALDGDPGFARLRVGPRLTYGPEGGALAAVTAWRGGATKMCGERWPVRGILLPISDGAEPESESEPVVPVDAIRRLLGDYRMPVTGIERGAVEVLLRLLERCPCRQSDAIDGDRIAADLRGQLGPSERDRR